MTNNTLPARDVAFLTAFAEFLLASGGDRAADAIYSVVKPCEGVRPADTQIAVNQLNRRIARSGKF